MFAAILLVSVGADPAPQYVVENKMPRFTVVNKIDPTGEGPNPHTPYDPYGHGTYESFRKAVEAGGKGILVVGVKDKYVGGYQIHCWVKSGWEGFADGEWDCFILNGKAVMEPRKEVSVPATPKAPGATWDIEVPTTAQRAAPSRGRSADTSRTDSTYTLTADGFGPTNCPPGVL